MNYWFLCNFKWLIKKNCVVKKINRSKGEILTFFFFKYLISSHNLSFSDSNAIKWQLIDHSFFSFGSIFNSSKQILIIFNDDDLFAEQRLKNRICSKKIRITYAALLIVCVLRTPSTISLLNGWRSNEAAAVHLPWPITGG